MADRSNRETEKDSEPLLGGTFDVGFPDGEGFKELSFDESPKDDVRVTRRDWLSGLFSVAAIGTASYGLLTLGYLIKDLKDIYTDKGSGEGLLFNPPPQLLETYQQLEQDPELMNWFVHTVKSDQRFLKIVLEEFKEYLEKEEEIDFNTDRETLWKASGFFYEDVIKKSPLSMLALLKANRVFDYPEVRDYLLTVRPAHFHCAPLEDFNRVEKYADGNVCMMVKPGRFGIQFILVDPRDLILGEKVRHNFDHEREHAYFQNNDAKAERLKDLPEHGRMGIALEERDIPFWMYRKTKHISDECIMEGLTEFITRRADTYHHSEEEQESKREQWNSHIYGVSTRLAAIFMAFNERELFKWNIAEITNREIFEALHDSLVEHGVDETIATRIINCAFVRKGDPGEALKGALYTLVSELEDLDTLLSEIDTPLHIRKYISDLDRNLVQPRSLDIGRFSGFFETLIRPIGTSSPLIKHNRDNLEISATYLLMKDPENNRMALAVKGAKICLDDHKEYGRSLIRSAYSELPNEIPTRMLLASTYDLLGEPIAFKGMVGEAEFQKNVALEYNEVIALYTEIIGIEKDHPEAHFQRGLLQLKRALAFGERYEGVGAARYESAISDIETGLKNHGEIWNWRELNQFLEEIRGEGSSWRSMVTSIPKLSERLAKIELPKTSRPVIDPWL